jgi:hypothetical protein
MTALKVAYETNQINPFLGHGEHCTSERNGRGGVEPVVFCQPSCW